MHVSGYSADPSESGAAALPRDSRHPLAPDLPFPATVGPADAVAHDGWREACDRALAAVLAGPGVVLVLGPAGTGKTLLLQHLAGELRARGMDVLLSTRGYFDPADKAGIGQPRAVLIDEADRLSPESLDGLGHLGRCAFVLAGVTEPHEESGPIAGEGASIIRLAPLPAGEVGAFVTARLVQVGLRPDILTEGAIERLAALSAGVPRLLNMLTGSALFLARTAGASRVEAAHVIEAAALREGPSDLALEPPAEASPPAEPQPPGPRTPGRGKPARRAAAIGPASAQPAGRHPASTAAPRASAHPDGELPAGAQAGPSGAPRDGRNHFFYRRRPGDRLRLVPRRFGATCGRGYAARSGSGTARAATLGALHTACGPCAETGRGDVGACERAGSACFHARREWSVRGP
ncbi:MAG: AAA family ATPase [Alphaproteobacteria bacterium]|nr:AAA family ATPase [Alphaproteobacteria bacterium]